MFIAGPATFEASRRARAPQVTSSGPPNPGSSAFPCVALRRPASARPYENGMIVVVKAPILATMSMVSARPVLPGASGKSQWQNRERGCCETKGCAS